MRILKLTVRLDVFIEADCTDERATDLAVNAVEVKSSNKDVELEVETIEVENEGE